MSDALKNNLTTNDLQLALSTVVSSVLQRQYLVNNDDVLTRSLKIRSVVVRYLELPAMVRIKSLRTPLDNNWYHIIFAIQCALTGCYLPNVFHGAKKSFLIWAASRQLLEAMTKKNLLLLKFIFLNHKEMLKHEKNINALQCKSRTNRFFIF